MNLKQRRFAEYYHESGNATQSAERAGYSDKTAYSQGQRLLKKVEISEYIRELSKQEQNARIISAVERQELLSDIAKNGENSPADRIKAVDTLNKMTGEYTVKVDTTVKTSDKLADVFKQIGGEGLEE